MTDVQEIRIDRKWIGGNHPPLIVAEMSGNHNGSLERALGLVDAAADAGAHALKIQTYTADSLTLDHDGDGFSVDDPESPWAGQRLYDLYQEAYTPREWHALIFQRCRERGMIGFSTPFDHSAVEFLLEMDIPVWKIASFELVDIPLIQHVAATGRPLILSTGMASLEEIEEAVDAFRSSGGRELILLRCTSAYPADASDADLRAIPDMMQRFRCPVGLSDHSPGITVAVAAVALGACLVEKHFTLSRDDGGVDSAFSLEPGELQQLVEESTRAHKALGTVRYGPLKREQQSLVHRRSLYAIADIRAGEEFTRENVRSIRPGFGMHPRHLSEIIGKQAICDIKRGSPLNFKMVNITHDR